MGNNASQSGNIAQRQQVEPEQQWAHSFPRTPQRLNQHKVLPDVSADILVQQKLKPTNNGDILYSGGTISGRHQSTSSLSGDNIQNEIHRSSSISSQNLWNFDQVQEIPHIRKFSSNPRNQMGRNSSGRDQHIPVDVRHSHNHHSQMELQQKRFGSVPDLRGRDTTDHLMRDARDNINKSKKKYKAPPPPAMMSSDMSSYNGETPLRKTRLFKTRTEMKKKQQSSQNQRRNTSNQMQDVNNDESNRYVNKSKDYQPKLPETTYRNDRNTRTDSNNKMALSDMRRSRSIPEFQAELRETTQKRWLMKLNQMQNEETNLPVNDSAPNFKQNSQRNFGQQNKENKLKTLDPNVSETEHLKYKLRQIEKSHNKEISQVNSTNRNPTSKSQSNMEASGSKTSEKDSTPDQSPLQKNKANFDAREQPSKTFYFGMDDTDTSYNNSVNNFALNLQKYNCILPTQNYSCSDLSSETEMENGQPASSEIALHLRPILPKKQLEVPRFSPAAAWRLLSAFNSNQSPSTVSDEGPVFIEDRIEKFARQPPHLNLAAVGPRSNHDKSGDSGISGDAGPPGFEDHSDPTISNIRNNHLQIGDNSHLNLSWTPQQDLEGEEGSSLEGGINKNSSNHMYARSTTSLKFTPCSQVFSLSLPRDNHLAAYLEEKARVHASPSYTNLQKLKRSVSGVLGNFSGKSKDVQPSLLQDQSDNWFLSRSAPNSLNNGFNSLEIRLLKHNSNIVPEFSDEGSSSLVPHATKNTPNLNGGRVMYLPECGDNNNLYSYQKDNDEMPSYKQQRKKDKLKSNPNPLGVYSGISKSCEHISSDTVTNNIPFAPEDLQDESPRQEEKIKERKPKKFTFQSTVRQIERRRLAEKLSQEAERKEQQRLSELEVMRRVEEEFQRKRAKEKASIRQQLRLFSMEDNAWSSLPPNWDNKLDVPSRSEPDGAVSSSASSLIMDNNVTKPLTLNTEQNYAEPKSTHIKKRATKKLSPDVKLSPVVKKFVSRQGSDSSEDTKLKAQATQVLSEYRQHCREYKDYRVSSRCLMEGSENDPRQTTVHPQVICNMPKAQGHQGSNNDGSSRSNNYRRDFAYGIMLPGKGSTSNTDDSQQSTRKHSPRISHNQRIMQGKCIS